MTLPVMPAGAGRQSGWRFAGAALLVVLVPGVLALGVTSLAVRAEEPDPLSATVAVDATADTVVKARDKARIDGQRKALAQIADTLAGGPGKGKSTKLDDNAITDMVVSFEVANERMSAVRYVADYTFHFRRADVQKALHVSGPAAPAAPAAGGGGKPALVLPVYQIGTNVMLWDDPDLWRDAWAARQAPDHLTLALGDVADVAAIDAEKARTGDSDTLAAIGKKYGTDDVLVALAAVRGPSAQPAGLDVSVKRYRDGQFVDVHGQSFDANPGESTDAFLARTAQATAAAIAGNWQGIAPQYDQQGSVTAVLTISGLDDWLKLRDRIAGLPAIRKIELRSLSRQEATIEIGYVGDVDQLKSALAGLGLELVKGDTLWHLSRTTPPGPAGPSPPPPPSPSSPPPFSPPPFPAAPGTAR